MDEFSLITSYFKDKQRLQDDIIFGVGDDAACLSVPEGMHLLVSTDTLVANVHFLTSWDAYDIGYRSVMVNLSDIAAMGGVPRWVTLALTLPVVDAAWIAQLSRGIFAALDAHDVALVGGDTTQGPLSLTITVHGLVPKGKAVRRNGAAVGDGIYVTGPLGGAAACLAALQAEEIPSAEWMTRLVRPKARLDFVPILQSFASAAIDISDGLSADLHHICVASEVGACLWRHRIPCDSSLDFALSGGDDYELCFTVSPAKEQAFLDGLAQLGLPCFNIGVIEAAPGLRIATPDGKAAALSARGYRHF